MRFPEEVTGDVRNRLSRIEGQVRGLQRMLDEGKDCKEIVTQLAAVQAALDRAGFRLMSAGLRHCIDDPDGSDTDAAELERLFLKLA
ncbi:MAG: metal-sensitive transcriptional regulator [Acidimicrobiia bacterium]|nr:metal-sensitive transcriptional regulator [Acidimicrobiia bacterium]